MQVLCLVLFGLCNPVQSFPLDKKFIKKADAAYFLAYTLCREEYMKEKLPLSDVKEIAYRVSNKMNTNPNKLNKSMFNEQSILKTAKILVKKFKGNNEKDCQDNLGTMKQSDIILLIARNKDPKNISKEDLVQPLQGYCDMSKMNKESELLLKEKNKNEKHKIALQKMMHKGQICSICDEAYKLNLENKNSAITGNLEHRDSLISFNLKLFNQVFKRTIKYSEASEIVDRYIDTASQVCPSLY